MKQGIVKFSKEFVTPIGLKEWASCEMEYDMASEDPKDVLTAAKKTVIEWYEVSSKGLIDNSIPPGPYTVISVERTSEDKRLAKLIKDMYACTQLSGDDGLCSYEKLAASNKEAKAIYDIMYRKIAISNSIINDTIKYGNA